jgi:transcription antitermination factor NusG
VVGNSLYSPYRILFRTNCSLSWIAQSRRPAYCLSEFREFLNREKPEEWDSEGEAVPKEASVEQVMSSTSTTIQTAPEDQARWYAVRTRPRHEKKVASELQEKGIRIYLPLLTQVRRWSDRRKVIQVPLFSCYAFVHSVLDLHLRLALYGISGALGFVGPNNQAVPIPDTQIETIQTLMASNVQVTPYPFLKVGQRVRVRGGALDGVEGILAAKGDRRLVVSVDSIHSSFSINLEGYDVEPV